MTSSFDYTPPALAAQDAAEEHPGPVLRRHVFYIPGYDPEARTRYRMLFVRELTRYAKRFAQPKSGITRATLSADGLVQSWSVAAQPETGGAQTGYDVLLWDDLVRSDFARWRLLSVALLVIAMVQTIATGLIVRFYRLNWKCANVILYPLAMVALLALGTVLIGVFVHAHLGEGFGHSLGWPLWVTAPLGLLAGLAWIKAIESFLNRVFFWQLLNDWVFNWQHAHGWRPDYEARLEVFADRVLARLTALAADGIALDEVMIVGHSSGGLTAVEVAARVLARDPRLGAGQGAHGQGPHGQDPHGRVGEREWAFSLVTLASGLPLVAIQPRAAALRREIAGLVTSGRLVWADYQAPQDWMNFPGFNPVRHLDLDLGGVPVANPLVRSAKFREIISTETYRKVRWRPFRMHFQFLLSNDRPGDYDFFAMTLGPQRLRDRVLRPLRSGAALAEQP